jgi:LysM repeat protein
VAACHDYDARRSPDAAPAALTAARPTEVTMRHPRPQPLPKTRASIAVAVMLAAALIGCTNSAQLAPVPANSPVTITTATPYAQPPAPTIVNADGLVAGSTPSIGSVREVTYAMEAGDTVLALATRFGTTVEAIMKRNNITDPNSLKIGQTLIIPTNSTILATTTPTAAATTTATATATPAATATPKATVTPPAGGTLTVYTVAKGDNAFDIAGTFGVSVEDLAAANGKTVAQLAAIQIGDKLNIPRPR